VTAHKKKIVAFLAITALGSAVLAVRSFRTTPGERKPENLKFEAGSLFANEPNLPARGTDNLSTGELARKMIISALVVAALGIAVIYISKKFLPKITNPPGKEIRIIETTHLGPRKAVHLIEICNQRLLIGSTNESIIMLANVTDASPQTNLSDQEKSPIFENINGR
jgi:flagellar biosynthetic protein FliO